jgi:hypothetical protein
LTCLRPDFCLIHRPSGVAAAAIERLDGWWEKGRGVIGMPPLPVGKGVWLPGVSAVHTLLVGYPLDLLFLDARLQQIRLISAFPGWRPFARASGARHTIEIGAGTLQMRVPSAGQGDAWLLRPLLGSSCLDDAAVGTEQPSFRVD